MSLLELSRVNLKLLVCLQALLEEQSVSRAAQRLCLSQSAVSKSLSQLRELTGDPLFTRTAHGLMPTVRAMQLKQELSPLLDGLWSVIQPKLFDPFTCSRHFRISLPETASQLLFRQSLPLILNEAPELKIKIKNLSLDNLNGLASGKIDLVLLPHDLDCGQNQIAGLHRQRLYQDTLACLVRKHHPCLLHEWNIDSWLRLKHMGIGTVASAPSIVDRALAELSLKRKIVIAVDDFHSATGLCENTDLVFTSSSLWASYAQEHYQIAVLPVPLPVEPVTYELYWHERNHNDQAHQWLRNLLIKAAEQLGT